MSAAPPPYDGLPGQPAQPHLAGGGAPPPGDYSSSATPASILHGYAWSLSHSYHLSSL